MAIRRAWAVLALGVGLLMVGGRSAALGLGPAEVRSGLGQPLVVVLPLIGPELQRLDPQEVSVSLAGREAYARAALDYPYLLRELRGALVQTGAGPVLRLSTEMPVYEPLIHLLVELRWPRGRLIRSVAVLLDPIQGPGAVPGIRRVAPPPRAARAGSAVPQQVSAAAPGERSYGPVARGETLSGIAARLRTDSRIGLDRWMQALYRRNPQAFGASMDVLKQGAVLVVPSPEEVARTEIPPRPTQTAVGTRRSWPSEPPPPSREAMPEPAPGNGPAQQHLYILADGKQGRAQAGPSAANGPAGSPPVQAAAPVAEQPLPRRLHQARRALQGLRHDNQLLRESVARLQQQMLGSQARLERLISESRRLREVLQALKAVPREVRVPQDTAQASAWAPGTVALGLVALGLGLVLIWRRYRARQPAPAAVSRPQAEVGQGAQTRRDPLEWRPVPEVMEPPAGPGKTTQGGSLGGSGQIVAEYLPTGELDLTDSRVHEEIINSPGHEEVKLLLLTFYKEMGRHKELRALAERILERHPDASQAFRRQLQTLTEGVASDAGGEADTEVMEQGEFAPGVPELLHEETGQTQEMPVQGSEPGRPGTQRSS